MLTIRLGGTARASTARTSLTIGYPAPYPEQVKLTVTPRGEKPTIVARTNAHTGSNHIIWNEKLHGKPAKPGTYTLTITTAHNAKQTRSTLTIKLS